MRILHISDLHIEPEPEERLPGLMATLERDRDQLVSARPDLVIVSGDLTTFGSSTGSHLSLAKDWLDDLGLPYLAVAGNHDLGSNAWQGEKHPKACAYEDVPFAETRFGRIFGSDPLVTRDLGLVRVVGASVREGDPDGVLPRLEEFFAADRRPVICFTHYPVVEAREPRIHPDFGSADWLPETAKALQTLITRYRNVRLYAAGHVHVSSVRQVAPHCLQITAGSLGQGSSSFRVYDLNAEGLTYSTVMGSGPLEFWENPPDLGFHIGYDDERSGRINW